METARSLRPDVMTWDPSPTELWRPGVLWAVNAPNMTLRVFLHRGAAGVRDYTVAASLLPNAGIGSPVACKFTSEAYAAPADVQPGEWPPGGGPGSGTRERDAVTQGVIFVGIIPRRITGAPLYWDW